MATTGPDEPITFVISVAAELAGMHPQTLRQYDRLGLVIPARTKGRGRRYTKRDVQRLRDVQRMSQEEGINLAGIRRILELERRVEALEAEPGIAPRSPRPLPAARSPCGIRCVRSRPWLPPGLRHATHCRDHLRACDLSSRERSSPADTVAHLLVDLPARPDAPASGRHSVSESSVRVLGASGFSRTLTRYSPR